VRVCVQINNLLSQPLILHSQTTLADPQHVTYI